MDFSDITRQHILQAIREIDLRRPELNASTIYDVVYRGKRYPPLELLRLANRLANGTAEWALAAGTATNAYLEKLGFSVVQKRPLLVNLSNEAEILVVKEPEAKSEVPVTKAASNVSNLQESEEAYRKLYKKTPEKYTRKKALAELFLSEEQLDKTLNALRTKKNIILQGAPGTGKTFLARRLAYLELGAEITENIQTVQFHASYSYEDFIQGFRPDAEGKFSLHNGVFYTFCERAKANPEKPYFFIIEELNRGNLSSIFGELLLLLEADKRGESFALGLPYSDQKFWVPENLYVIGTMNTADRQLTNLDFALRRRFAFVKMTPAFGLPFRRFLEYRNTPDEIINLIISRIQNLNQAISQDNQLGDGFQIGHSYFCYPPKEGGGMAWFEEVVQNELAPLLEEYWSDKSGKDTIEIQKLMAK